MVGFIDANESLEFKRLRKRTYLTRFGRGPSRRCATRLRRAGQTLPVCATKTQDVRPPAAPSQRALRALPGAAPDISTLHFVRKCLDADTFEAEFNDWLDKQARQHVLAADIDSRQVIAQSGQTGRRDAAEGTALRWSTEDLDRPGTWVFADALRAKQRTAARRRRHDIEYVFTVKDNQPTLCAWLGRNDSTATPMET